MYNKLNNNYYNNLSQQNYMRNGYSSADTNSTHYLNILYFSYITPNMLIFAEGEKKQNTQIKKTLMAW